MNKLTANIKLAFTTNSLLHGALMAAETAVAGAMIPICQSGTLPTLAQLKLIGIAAVSAFGLYIAKNIIAGSSAQVTTKQ